nr:glycosyltransferase family 2 protein [Acidisarcina polymorpha]
MSPSPAGTSIHARPQVSVIIPTHHRPVLVERAIRSALGQSFQDIEVIVIVDGSDADTETRLEHLDDERLHVLCLRDSVGGADARNLGVRYSRGKWVALLDDDDEWLPMKLSVQWAAAEKMSGEQVFIASRFIERTENAERVLPKRSPSKNEEFSEYLFARQGWTSGEAFLQTSTWFVSRQLMLRVPFTTGLKRCQDLDWLLHATSLPDTQVEVLTEVLAIFHHDERNERVSRTSDWKFLYDWAIANRSLFSHKAFAYFVATFCAPAARKQREGWRTFLFLLKKGIFGEYSSAKCLLLLLVCWFIPEANRRHIRAIVVTRLETREKSPAVWVNHQLSRRSS